MPSGSSLEGPVGDVFPCIDTKDEEIKKKEVVSIGDLNKFISNSDDQVIFLVPRKLKMCFEFQIIIINQFIYCLGEDT